MKKIVIIGANSFQNPLILKAKEMGYETHVFAWQDGSIGEKTADYFYPVSIVEKEEILKKCMEIKPDGIVTIASDLAVITVNYVAEKMGLTGNTINCTKISTNKFLMRQALKSAGLYTPDFRVVSNEQEILAAAKEMKTPLIVKPTDRSGSRAITKIINKEEIQAAANQAMSVSFEKKAIIEEYIEGDEYSFETVSFNGEHHFLTITKKYTTGYPHYIETGHIEPCGLSEEKINTIKKYIFKALDALEIKNGASHAEFKIDSNDNIGIIEIGGRMGGDCIGSDLVKLSCGYDFLKMVIEVATNKEPQMIREEHSAYAAIKFIFSKKDVDALNRLKDNKNIKLEFVSPISENMSDSIIDSSTRYGYYIFTSKDGSAIEEFN